ncbi:Iron-sulfur assembly protein 1 [Tolypocladium capitatum]|uniref:Iron-sulfur assembly protein 1 n=1 Tax=Tolypocladium capitatum TaxID=45235 RepID=A0A2K3QKW9_9HYPO|nr:Iron-sulfur assembly protein 1 [Tolypocladium capitatum]
MKVPFTVARVALRHGRRSLRPLSAPSIITVSANYHSYSLPTRASSDPSSNDIPETPIAQPEPLPRVHETRPPPPTTTQKQTQDPAPPAKAATPPPKASSETQTEAAAPRPKAERPRRELRARKAAMKLTPAAVEQLRRLLDQPEPKLIKVGVRNRGCSGLAYHLEYVDKPGAFDEAVEQDGVKVLIDSKALFSIIGTEMDWAEDKLNQRFVFKNPNIKEQCGCGESFMV